MTKRVRFTPFVRAGVFAAALWVPGHARAAEVPIAPPVSISTEAQRVPSFVPADVDRDGDLDLLVADEGNGVFGGRVLLLRNVAGNGSSWSSVTVSTEGGSPRSVAAADVDGDGDVDTVSASLSDDEISWHENVGGTSWTTHTIATLDGAIAVATGDIDRDGDLDVVAAGLEGNGAIRFYQNGGGGASWTARTVGTPGFGVMTVAVADLDGDGDLDVLTRHEGGGPAWYENAAGGSTWTLHSMGTASLALRVAAADVDRDGDVDVIQTRTGSPLTWYENVPGPTWTPHAISTPGVQISAAIPADLDGDGDIDVWALRDENSFTSGVHWYENVSGNGISWARHVVVSTQSYSTAVAIADLDGDGDLEGLSTWALYGARILRHDNETLHRNACFAPPVTVSTAAGALRGLAIADIDRDGDVDVVTDHASVGNLLWHENSANGAGWSLHTFATINGPLSVATADVDRDGDPDVVASSGIAPHQALWFENLSGGASFTLHSIAAVSGAAYGSQVVTGDIDGDGDMDVFQSAKELVGRWYPNTSGNGSTWGPAVTVGGTSGELVDIDGDGDLDVASAYADFSGMHQVGWAENVVGTGAAWSMHTISTAVSWPNVIAAGDVDGDGDVDFAQGGLDPAPRWRINEGGGSSWTVQTVDGAGLGGTVADLDGDGDLDLPWAGQSPPRLGWHENRNGLGSEWLGHALPLTGTPSDVGPPAAADIDRDGDLDLITNSGLFVWYPNQGGQFSLAAENTAPGTSQQGTMVSMLRVVATHLGRAGDGALELARFGVLLEEAAGDPLTSAEANLLVESLRVYRDADGNGTFEPTDALVASIDTLTLAAGVQVVPFADGDPNVTVAFGTPRTYFLVVELTADAATQNPNRVRTTLLQLGASASQAEHAAYDLTLEPACPADVASGVTVAVVPVELMGFTIE